ncbi:MAG: hypothetical protein H8E64_01315 [Candidatus Marinimicrobia bacterium]|nr:hypothetical protein [Candidatus Neomarinimicrobiota bacterium]
MKIHKQFSGKLLIVGGASLDVLSINATKHSSPGGAGLYTALAAAQCGADVTLLSPFPNPMPESLSKISSYVNWIGPSVHPDELPSFHIVQIPDKTIYKHSFFGAEEFLSPKDLPDDLSMYDLVHIVPLGNTARQLSFIHTCRNRGARFISAGTGIPLIQNNPDLIHDVIKTTDLFFMNEEEAHVLFSTADSLRTATGKLLVVTMGGNGASVFIGEHEIIIDAVDVSVVDPTGAGDTFCGATIAGIVNGEHPAKAAMHASKLAAKMISGIGPEKLFTKPIYPKIDVDSRVEPNSNQIGRTAKLISKLTEEAPYDFIASSLPPLHHPLAVDFFFVTTLQQFSFWSVKNGRYHLPLHATIGGEHLKGAFYLFMAYLNKLKTDPEYFTPKRQAEQTYDEMVELFRSDEGENVMPAIEMHLCAAHRYGKTMQKLALTPQRILKTATATNTPLKTFLQILDHIGGYREDPLRKKSALLAMILNNRPETHFSFGKNESLPPIVDYHCMRSCIRMGLIDINDSELYDDLKNRKLVSEADEWSVRYSAYCAVDQLADRSGRSMATVDKYFFFSRKRCPEMSEPDCAQCSADSVCEHRKELFQPVIRTDFY